MDVEICKSVDIETTVDVSIEEFVSALTEKFQADGVKAQDDPERRYEWRYFLSSISNSIMLLREIPEDLIKEIKPAALEIITRNLSDQAKRWTRIAEEAKAK